MWKKKTHTIYNQTQAHCCSNNKSHILKLSDEAEDDDCPASVDVDVDGVDVDGVVDDDDVDDDVDDSDEAEEEPEESDEAELRQLSWWKINCYW